MTTKTPACQRFDDIDWSVKAGGVESYEVRNGAGRTTIVYPDSGRRERVPPKQFESHEHEMYAKVHGEKLDVIEELHSDEMKRAWPKYGSVRKPDGSGGYYLAQGPLPFRSSEERRDYLKLSREVMGQRGFAERA